MLINIGDEFKRRREDLEMTTKEVGEVLKIKESDIIFLEQNSIKSINKNLYLEVFVKSYCELLKIDKDFTKELLNNIKGSSNKKSKHRLINLESDLNPGRDYIVNASIIFLIICLFLVSFGRFDMNSSKLTKLIIHQFSNIK
jgi:cytoskeletal protein RodZ